MRCSTVDMALLPGTIVKQLAKAPDFNTIASMCTVALAVVRAVLVRGFTSSLGKESLWVSNHDAKMYATT